jgi:drug/metabolite transporter (DMT)-like permease
LENKLAILFIGAAASLWGIIGIFVSYFYELGFSPIQVVTIRALSSSVFLVFYVCLRNRQLFRIKVSDSKYFIGTGIFSIVLFNWCLFSTIEETSISIASILLYTAPAFVTIFSRLIFKEALTTRKVIALITTFVGCSLVIGILPHTDDSISIYGLILGLGSGLFYALYSIIGKFALKKYHSLTVTVYTFLFAAIAVTPFSGLWNVIPLLTDIEVWFYIIGIGFLSTMLPFLFYTKGLNTIESSQASIIATIEPVVASLMGFMFFYEKLNLWQYTGIIFVIAAVIISSKTTKKTLISDELSHLKRTS